MFRNKKHTVKPVETLKMGQGPKTVSVLDIAKGALAYLPDVPRLVPNMVNMALLRPQRRVSLATVFESQAQAHADRPFLRDQTKTFTYQEADAMANQMARAFISLGVKRGGVVGILSKNRWETVIAVIAAAKIGAVSALLNPNQQGDVQAHSLSLVKPALVLACAHGLAILKALQQSHPERLAGVEVAGFEGASDSLAYSNFKELWTVQSPRALIEASEVTAKSPCFYIFTSGTTGLPKASVMSHYRWLQAMYGMQSATRLSNQEVLYCCLPLYHNNALTVSLGMVIAAGACMALDEKFSASRFWERIRFYNANAFCYIGELLRYLLNQAPNENDQNHEIRFITGNGLRPELWADFEARFGIEQIFEFYGASESNLGFMNAFGLRETVGFCPMPYRIVACDPDTEQVIRDSHGRCTDVKLGEVGLLISEVTRLRPFDGYTDPKANEGKLLRNVFSQGDCWYNSGDLMRRQGWRHVQFVDRLGDTFRWKGENVATSEVEGALAKLPWIEHAVVYGVQVPGSDGRAGMAAISTKEGKAVDWSGLAEYVSAHLPSYAIPQYVRLLDQAQTTGTFKYQKSNLKRDGIDPNRVHGPLYAWDSRGRQYRALVQ